MKSLNLSRLTNPILESVGTQIINVLEKIQFTEEEKKEVKVFYDSFYEIFERFVLARQQTDISQVSSHKKELNDARNNMLSSLKMIAKAYLNSEVEVERAVAKDLFAIINKHEKDLKGKSSDLLSVMLNAIIEEIEEKIKAEKLSLIYAMKWFKWLKRAQEHFIIYAVDQSVAITGNTNHFSPSNLREEYLEKLELFLNYLHFQNMKTPSDNLDKLILGSEEIIAKASSRSKAKPKQIISTHKLNTLISSKKVETEDPSI